MWNSEKDEADSFHFLYFGGKYGKMIFFITWRAGGIMAVRLIRGDESEKWLFDTVWVKGSEARFHLQEWFSKAMCWLISAINYSAVKRKKEKKGKKKW